MPEVLGTGLAVGLVTSGSLWVDAWGCIVGLLLPVAFACILQSYWLVVSD